MARTGLSAERLVTLALEAYREASGARKAVKPKGTGKVVAPPDPVGRRAALSPVPERDVDDVADESFDRDLNRIIDENRELLDRLAR